MLRIQAESLDTGGKQLRYVNGTFFPNYSTTRFTTDGLQPWLRRRRMRGISGSNR